MAQQLGELVALTESLGSGSSTHTRDLTPAPGF